MEHREANEWENDAHSVVFGCVSRNRRGNATVSIDLRTNESVEQTFKLLGSIALNATPVMTILRKRRCFLVPRRHNKGPKKKFLVEDSCKRVVNKSRRGKSFVEGDNA